MPEMTAAAAEDFLRDLHVGVVAVERETKPPLALPIWYELDEAGNIVLWTHADSLKAKLLRKAGRASFTVQRETVPYAYVSVEGHVTSAPADDETALRIARRYLGDTGGDEFLASNPNVGSVLITIHKDNIRSVTFEE